MTVPRSVGSWVVVVRVAWVVVALFALGIFAVSIADYWTELQRVCNEGARTCSDQGFLTPKNVGQLETLGVSVRIYAAYVVVLRVVSFAVWVALGAVIFWRKSEDLMALLVAFMLVTFGTSFQSFSYGSSMGFTFSFLQGLSGGGSPVMTSLFHILAALGFTTLILFLYLFPDGRFVPGWARWAALAWIANDCVAVFYPRLFDVLPGGDAVGFALFFVPALCAVGSQIHRYRRISGPEQRQQTKWVIFGTSIGFGGFLVLVALQGILPGFAGTGVLGGLFAQTVITVLFLMIPLSTGVAILRSRLFDIDVVINRALVYALLTTALLLVYAGCVVGLQFGFRVVAGQGTQLAIVTSTLAIAVLFNPLRHRIQDLIDRLFYRKKYDAVKTLGDYSHRLREEVDLENLAGGLMAVVEETIQPAHVSLWLRDRGERTRMRTYR